LSSRARFLRIAIRVSISGRLDVRNQTPFEPGTKALLQTRNFFGRPVGTDDDLLAGVVQRIEGVEKLLLDGLLFCNELKRRRSAVLPLAVALSELKALIHLGWR
jgi:hypothetical protein